MQHKCAKCDRPAFAVMWEMGFPYGLCAYHGARVTLTFTLVCVAAVMTLLLLIGAIG